MLFRERTGLQDLVIFESYDWGRVLALDGVVQTTTGDEFCYHEMIVHVPILAHGAAREVLIIGGGDGGCLREALKHAGRRAGHPGRDRRGRDRAQPPLAAHRSATAPSTTPRRAWSSPTVPASPPSATTASTS